MSFPLAFDLAVLLLTVTLAVRGVFRGFSGEVFSLAGTIGGVVLAWKYASLLSDWIRNMWDGVNGAFASVCAMVAIYIAVVLLSALLCRAVKAILRFAYLTFLDRALGFLAGLLKSAALVLFLYVGIATYSPFLPTAWMSGSLVMRGADTAWPPIRNFLEGQGLLPDGFSLPSLDLSKNPAA